MLLLPNPKGIYSLQLEESEDTLKSLIKILPTILFQKLYHVGDLQGNPQENGDLEGPFLSVSEHPEAWREIARLGNSPTWEITSSQNLGLIDARNQGQRPLPEEELYEFLLQMWQIRAKEKGLPIPDTLENACKFVSLFLEKTFQIAARGNSLHQFNQTTSGKIIDICKAEPKLHYHDSEFWMNPEHRKSLKSCIPRVLQWKKLWESIHGKSPKSKTWKNRILTWAHQKGIAFPKTHYQTPFDLTEEGDLRYFISNSLKEAQEEANPELLEKYPIKQVTHYQASQALKNFWHQRSQDSFHIENPKCTIDMVLSALIELATKKNISNTPIGIWWQETFDPLNYSAPRGSINPNLITTLPLKISPCPSNESQPF